MGSMSKFPNGFSSGVAIRGVPVLNSHGGDVYWVDSGAAFSGDGTFTRPFKTIDTAINNCTANNGDIIMVKPGHAETLATASAITCDVAGVTVIGLGSGADRPTLTFSDTAATVVVSAASVTWEGVVIKPSVDAVVSPFVVSGADCWLDFESQDASALVEFERTVLTTAGADRLYVNNKHRGFIAGDACVNLVRLVGVDGGDINVDFYGVASTSVVEFHTTACHNITVNGEFYNSGTTDLSKNVVDTVTGSTWDARGFDGAAGQSFSGGSGAALAGDDVGAVASAVAVIDAFHDVPTADAATNAQMRDVVGNKTDAAVQAIAADKSALAYLKGLVDALMGTAGIASFPAAAAPANGVSLAESVRYLSEQQAPRLATKATGDLTAFGTSLSLFTVTGDVLVKVGGSVDVAVTSTSGTTTLEVGVAGNTACLCVQDAVDNTAFAIGDSWTLDTAADANGAQLSTEWVLVGNGVDIVLTGSVDDITAGDIDFYCLWKPLSADGAVVAA